MNPVKFGNNTFCGPSVISAIAGISTDEAASVCSQVTGRKKVAGLYIHELKEAFKLLGYSTKDQPLFSQTVFGNLFALREDGYYVFMVPGHFIALEINGSHRYICDNHSKIPIRVSSSARLGDKAVSCFKVEKK